MVMHRYVLAALLIAISANSSAFGQLRIDADVMQARADAVVVDDHPLLHTGQIFPVDGEGQLTAESTGPQAEAVFARLRELIDVSKSTLGDVVKLNIYVNDVADVPLVMHEINKAWVEEHLPAVMWVETPLPIHGARVAADAVAISRLNDTIDEVLRDRDDVARKKPAAMWSILPQGRAVYIAGQAEPGQTLAEATTKTLQSLHDTLEYMQLNDDTVVQIKSFLNPMSQIDEVDQAIAAFYKDRPLPPVSHVEWGSKGAIEIEMIAYVPADNEFIPADEAVVFLTPPTMTSSPVFSRIAVINSPVRIYTSGLTAAGDGDGEHEVRDIYSQLETILKKTGGDLRHLVKATYYVSADESSNQLNMLRPNYYDPKRPPSASKAPVAGVGQRNRTLSIDMIAVPKDEGE